MSEPSAGSGAPARSQLASEAQTLPPPAAAEPSGPPAAAAGGPVYFVLHIPKTAGQTIQTHFAEHGAPGVLWLPKRRLRAGRAPRPGDSPDFARARVISGHEIGCSLENFFPGREIRRIVLLRDPVDLQISLYNWRMMNHLAKGLGTYGFTLHLQAQPLNFMTHFLLSRWLEISWGRLIKITDGEKFAMLNRALADFWFVGAHAQCNRVVAAIAGDLGAPPTPVARNTSLDLQAHTGWRLVTAADLTPAQRAAITARNPLDLALWKTWRAAGFAPAEVRPEPIAAAPGNAFFAHELARPWFRLRRLVRRQCIGRRRKAVLVDRANRARDRGRWQLAARDYREALRALPQAPAIWAQYGNVLKEAGQLAASEQAYRRALALAPAAADTHLQLGHALKLQRRIGEAEEAYQRALALDPAQGPARSELSALGWSAQRIADAVGVAARGAAGAADSG